MGPQGQSWLAGLRSASDFSNRSYAGGLAAWRAKLPEQQPLGMLRQCPNLSLTRHTVYPGGTAWPFIQYAPSLAFMLLHLLRSKAPPTPSSTKPQLVTTRNQQQRWATTFTHLEPPQYVGLYPQEARGEGLLEKSRDEGHDYVEALLPERLVQKGRVLACGHIPGQICPYSQYSHLVVTSTHLPVRPVFWVSKVSMGPGVYEPTGTASRAHKLRC